MRKFFIIFIITLVSCNLDMNNAIFQKFQRFIKKYHKKYNSINEYLARFEFFKRNVINSFHENVSYSTGITQFFLI